MYVLVIAKSEPKNLVNILNVEDKANDYTILV